MTTKIILSILAITFTLPLCGAQRLQRIMGHIKPSQVAASKVVAAKASSSEEVVISPEVEALVDSLMSEVPLLLRWYLAKDFEALKKAISESADINKDVRATKDDEGNTIVALALAQEQWDVLDLLISRGVAFDSTRMLWDAINKRKKITIIKKLVQDYKADVNARDDQGMTSLMYAAGEGNIEIVRYLVKECSANVEAQDDHQGMTVLMHAAKRGNIGVVIYLVKECGVHVEVKDYDGRTALMIAISSGFPETVQCLVKERGADIEARDDRGRTALVHAVLLCNTLYRNGALMRSKDKWGVKMVKYLIECGAGIETRDKNGSTSIDYAIEVIKQYLIKKQAEQRARKKEALFAAIMLTTAI